MLEYDRMSRVYDRFRNFLAAPSGETMHENGGLFRHADCGCIDAVRRERFELGFIYRRARPSVCICIDNVRVGCGFFRIVGDGDVPEFLRRRSNVGVGLVALGRANINVHARLCTGEHERVRGAAALAEVCELYVVELAEVFGDREKVGQSLARTERVRQPVYDRKITVFRDLLDDRLLLRADDEPVDPVP